MYSKRFQFHFSKINYKIIEKGLPRLAGSTWGAQTSTLRTAALALCFTSGRVLRKVLDAVVPTLTWLTLS